MGSFRSSIQVSSEDLEVAPLVAHNQEQFPKKSICGARTKRFRLSVVCLSPPQLSSNQPANPGFFFSLQAAAKGMGMEPQLRSDLSRCLELRVTTNAAPSGMLVC
jgi:hypothetical protein